MGNNKPNAYSLYVSHIWNERRKANKHVSKPNLFHELGEVWSKMAEAEKKVWKDRAKSGDNYYHQHHEYNGSKGSQGHQNDCTSTKSSQSTSSQEDKMDVKPDIKPNLKREREDDDVDDSKQQTAVALVDIRRELTVQPEKRLKPGVPRGQTIVEGKDTYCDFHLLQLRDQCDAIIRSRDNNSINVPLYSISTNVLCKYKTESKDIFIPLEICVCAFTLQDGTAGLPFHALIDAGDIPNNYYNKSHDHAKLHKISIPPNGYPKTARSDYRKVYKQLWDYTEKGERVLLVADMRNYDQIKGSMEWLYEKAKEENINKRVPEFSKWTFLPLVEFISLTYNHMYLKTPQKHVTKFMHYYIKLKVEDSSWDHNPNMMCQYHKEEEEKQTKWCALVCAKKAFLNLYDIFEIICKHSEISQKASKPAVTGTGEQVLSIEG